MICDSTSLVFTGDIGFDRYMSGKWTDPELLSPGILSFLRSGRHVIANVEGALLKADGKNSGRGVYFHAMDPAAAAFLTAIRADLWILANNHIMDAGPEGLASTRNIAASLGCRTLGAGKNLDAAATPVYLPEAGGIGIFSVGYLPECPPAGESTPGCFSWNEWDRIRSVIAEIKKTCRWCIMVCHGGEEFAGLPMPNIRRRYLRYLEMGADLVVAHHPHVPQHYETVGHNKAIFYSLGNFIFDTDYQRAQLYTDTGLLLKLSLTPDAFSFEALGMRLDRASARLTEAPVPAVFTDIQEAAYQQLLPLAARAFMAAEKRRMVYLDREKWLHADTAAWKAYFDGDEIEDYIRGEYMDFALVQQWARSGALLPEGSVMPPVENWLKALL